MNQSDLDALRAEADKLEADVLKQIADLAKLALELDAKGELERAKDIRDCIEIIEDMIKLANR